MLFLNMYILLIIALVQEVFAANPLPKGHEECVFTEFLFTKPTQQDSHPLLGFIRIDTPQQDSHPSTGFIPLIRIHTPH